MNFGQAISSGFSKYVQFDGVARRSEFWWWTLFCMLVSLVLGGVDGAMTGDSAGGVLTRIWALAVLLPSLAIGVRRLRDAGYTWGYLFVGLIPLIGPIILIALFCSPGRVSTPAPYAHPML
ncbi:MAG: DUF805 domain-containing protein [Ramlibacter sp.]|nr:DUF805 domain-containing protein [Cryobacterium sp.]